MIRTLVILFGVVTLWTAAACGGGGEETIDLGDGGEVTLGGDLPDSFPDDFPIYDGADLGSAIEGEQDGVVGIVATWATGDDFEDVKDFYSAAFEDGPWVSAGTGSSVGTIYWSLEHSDGDQVGYLAVTDGDEVAIAATVGDDPSASTGDDQGDDDQSGDDSASDSDDSDDADTGDDQASADDGSETGGDEGAIDPSLPEEVDLSSDFPNDRVAFPDGVRVTGSSSISSDGATTHFVSMFSEESVEDLAAFFKSDLEGQGFTQSIQTSDSNGVYAVYFENPDGTGMSVTVSVYQAEAEGYREIGLQVTNPGV